MSRHYKVLIVGNAGCGKSNLVKGLRGLPVDANKYQATVGAEVTTLTASNGDTISIWDLGGQAKFDTGDKHYHDVDICYVMKGGVFWKSTREWGREVEKVSPNAKFILMSSCIQPGVLRRSLEELICK